MKKFFFVIGILGGVAIAAGTQRVAQETQFATRSAPTAASFTSAASLNLDGLTDFRVMVCTADTSDMPAAVGSLKAYLFDEREGKVSRNKLLDLDMTTQELPANGACINFPDQQVGPPYDRVMYSAVGLKLSDGGTLMTQTDGGLDAGAFVIYYRGWNNSR